MAEPRLNLNSLTHVRAWPLPHHEMNNWLPYETLLRGILASHPFNMDKVVRQGIPLKLTKSSIKVIFITGHIILHIFPGSSIKPLL